MDSLIQRKSQMISIIPLPRGIRAIKATWFLIFMCVAILYVHGLEHYTSIQFAYSMAVTFIITQVCHLIASLCDFFEEIAHVHTRYHGNYFNVLKSSLNVRHLSLVTLISIITYTFSEEVAFPRFSFRMNLLITLVCNLLCKHFGLQDPSLAAISEITEKKHLNVAHGLAWSYYVGYLKFVLPALKESVRAFNEENNNLLKSSEAGRLHILIPLSCRIHGDLKEGDKNLTFVKEVPPLCKDRGGIKKRVFKNNVYRILDEDHRPYYCIVEYATPLASLYEMSDVASAAFSKEDRIQQAKLFCRTLKDILENSVECHNAFRLVIYDDCRQYEGNGEHTLSEEILKHLKQQRSEEYDLCLRT
ncbi:stimulator of interferon genes protein [Hyperolius riggenbachi]|uniref:stimulator of interferon genes protein n=1 Tax=Hyperolius riggenbachi TaxID=752182 RepID=UPI0035A3238E